MVMGPLKTLGMVENSRPYRKALAEAGITVSLNPYSLLHADRGGG